MIQANELRIGNKVKCKVSNDAGIYTVLQIDGWMLKIMLDKARQGEWYNEDKIKPIPLTPEILEKAGFAKENDVFFRDVGDFILYFNAELGDFRYRRVSGYATSVTTLHQLQNLYFALTGEELNIQL